MSDGAFGNFLLFLSLLLAAAHGLGYLFTRLHQPRVIGEILAGIVLGPSLLGAAAHPDPEAGRIVLDLFYRLGLVLLMFLSGAETRNLFQRSDRRSIGWMATVGTVLPFAIVIAAAAWLPLESLMGPANHRVALLLVIGIAVAVTSIPVISRIFHDLKILHTRFARLVLGVAVLEDIALWAVLAVATAVAASQGLAAGTIALHVAVTLVFFAVGLTLAPRVLKRVHKARWNLLANASPAAYMVVVLFAYVAVASALGVNLVFAAFLAGFAAPKFTSERFGESLGSLAKFSFAIFIPVYFALVGYRLDLGTTFAPVMFAVFLVVACALKLASVALGARLAGFRGRDVLNLAITSNARGGPGIVLASVALDAGIISAEFYTTLVLVAVVTSQIAGAWLQYVLRRGWELLAGEETGETAAVVVEPRVA